jgi:hypothetical protein
MKERGIYEGDYAYEIEQVLDSATLVGPDGSTTPHSISPFCTRYSAQPGAIISIPSDSIEKATQSSSQGV